MRRDASEGGERAEGGRIRAADNPWPDTCIAFRREPDGELQLPVRDNGLGLSDAVTPHVVESFGLQPVDSLCEQLHATIEVGRHPGTTVTITFPEPASQSRGYTRGVFPGAERRRWAQESPRPGLYT